MPYTPIYAPRGNTLKSAVADQPSATFDILAFTGSVLGDRSEERKILLIWARAIVTEGQVGGSIAEYCAARHMQRRTFDRKRMRACQRIAAEKNRLFATAAAPRQKMLDGAQANTGPNSGRVYATSDRKGST
ncbi:hypothetical protein GGQ91_002500 [Methylobacterium fujisawaense]|uniref:Uncharacterized protein n=1 Tax=Methylobacterium fujisawaense TaxID=107400 RepID=A0ABR6DAI9_9HYPH|nr:hypothetical protein [Methylobacterium fujisawaense]MBA9063112.1 hypothetical protein [Methylobacterium fujisawaense]